MLTGSDVALGRETGHGGILSFWSRGAQSRFSGHEGALSLGGDVRTTMFGADYAKGAAGDGPVAVAQPGPGRSMPGSPAARWRHLPVEAPRVPHRGLGSDLGNEA